MPYKTMAQPAKSLSSLIEDGLSDLRELGEECQSAADNFPNPDHPKAQAFSEVADVLQGFDEPDHLDSLGEHADVSVVYSIQVQKDKRKGVGRSVRRDNACAQLSAAADKIREIAEEMRDCVSEVEESAEGKGEAEAHDAEKDSDELEEQATALEELADELEEAVSEAEGVEFPGLYG